MDRTQKIDCGVNGEATLTGATTEFQLKKGLPPVPKMALRKS